MGKLYFTLPAESKSTQKLCLQNESLHTLVQILVEDLFLCQSSDQPHRPRLQSTIQSEAEK